MVAGIVSGFVTAFLQTRMGINSLLSGIIVNTGLYSIIMLIMSGRPTLNMNSTEKTFDLEKDKAKKSEIDNFLNSLYNRFVKYGTPVMMDEFGALDKGTNYQSRVNFAAYYVAAASARGITCVWWDNHNFSGNGEKFGLIRRQSQTWVYPDIVLAIMANCLCNR